MPEYLAADDTLDALMTIGTHNGTDLTAGRLLVYVQEFQTNPASSPAPGSYPRIWNSATGAYVPAGDLAVLLGFGAVTA